MTRNPLLVCFLAQDVPVGRMRCMRFRRANTNAPLNSPSPPLSSVFHNLDPSMRLKYFYRERLIGIAHPEMNRALFREKVGSAGLDKVRTSGFHVQ
jgi:hypothetical protein